MFFPSISHNTKCYLWASLIAQLVKNPPVMQDTPVRFLGWEEPMQKGEANHSSILGLPLWLSWLRICPQCGRPGLGRSPGEGKGHPLQYSGLENSTDCIVHGVTKSWTGLSNFHFHFLISQVLEPGNPRSTGQHGGVLVTALFRLQNTASWGYPHRKQKESELSLDS